MDYKNDLDVTLSLIKRYCNEDKLKESNAAIQHDLSYDMGDYNFGEGDSRELRTAIRETIVEVNTLVRNKIGKFFNEEGKSIKGIN